MRAKESLCEAAESVFTLALELNMLYICVMAQSLNHEDLTSRYCKTAFLQMQLIQFCHLHAIFSSKPACSYFKENIKN